MCDRSYSELTGCQILDNEYSQSPIQRAEYFVELEDAFRAAGIVVPLWVTNMLFITAGMSDFIPHSSTYNDPNQGRNFINGTGAVDIYGLVSSIHPTMNVGIDGDVGWVPTRF